MSENRSKPTFNAGRNQYIAYAEQGGATQTVHVTDAGSSGAVAIGADLGALRELFDQLGPSAAPSAALMEAAEKAAESPEPSRQKVLGYVESAVKLAAATNGLAEQADKLIPRLQHVATWAGQTWDAWRTTLGL